MQVDRYCFKMGTLLVYLFLVGRTSVFAQSITASNFHVGGTSVKIGEGANMVLKEGLFVENSASFINNGNIYLDNEEEETLKINTLLDGKGIYYIYGVADYTFVGTEAGISSLSINGGNTLWLENDLAVTNSLILEDGIIEVADDHILEVQSADADAISFNNSIDNTSFVRGTVERNIALGNKYSFPLGTSAEGFHPFLIGNISSEGYVGVTYEPNFSSTWNSLGTEVELEEIGGWKVTTTESNISFIPGLSLYNINSVLDGDYNIFYSEIPDVISPEFSLDFNSRTEGTNLISGDNYAAGTFALAKIITTTVGVDGIPVPELVNFIVKNGDGRTTFEVPGIYNYSSVSLAVYDRFGNLVYKSNNYANDFDSKSYRAGTYFYELILKTAEDESIVLRNIIEIMERN